MNSLRVRVFVTAAVALAAICASVRPAAAQAIQGNFTLPRDVQWQGNTLKAGDYTFRMSSTSTPHLITLDGPKGSAMVISAVANPAKVGTQSEMSIEHRGSRSFVRELYLAQIGLRLRYAVPKAPKEAEIAQGPVTTEQILVAMK